MKIQDILFIITCDIHIFSYFAIFIIIIIYFIKLIIINFFLIYQNEKNNEIENTKIEFKKIVFLIFSRL